MSFVTSAAAAARPLCEALERRDLLSAAPTIKADPATGVLTVTGTRKADVIVLARAADGSLSVAANGKANPIDPAVTLTSITVLGGGGNDSISVDETHKPLGLALTIDGGSGDDNIVGSRGNDTLYGGSGGDSIVGGDGDDTIDGGKNDDRLSGGDGADKIVTGGGTDYYNTGANAGDAVDGTGSNAVAAPRAVAPPRATPQTFFGTRTGLTVDQIRSTYQFGNLNDPSFTNRGAGQAIAVVIPYSVINLTQSFTTFSQSFGLPTPDSTNFQIINATGTTPAADPDPNHGWEAEACTDVEWIHAIAPEAKIYVVLANSDLFPDVFIGIDKAVDTLVANNGGGVVCLTAGSQNGELDAALQAQFDQSFTRAAATTVSFVAGAGDIAGQVSYPATSPYVLGVGGSSLNTDNNGNLNFGEQAWSNGGGGLSTVYPTPSYQLAIASATARSSPDVAYNADPNAGFAVYDATPFGDVDGDFTSDSGWVPGGVGGTSVGAPQWAGLVALANQQRTASGRDFLGSGLNSAIYDLGTTFTGTYFNDITTGAAGANAAAVGYDRVTGLGSPKASALITALGTVSTLPLVTNVTFTISYLLPVQAVGPLQSPGGGFFVTEGSVAATSVVSIAITPGATIGGPTTPISPLDATSGTTAAINSLTFDPATRDPRTGKFKGNGTFSLLTTYLQPSDPTPPFDNPLGLDYPQGNTTTTTTTTGGTTGGTTNTANSSGSSSISGGGGTGTPIQTPIQTTVTQTGPILFFGRITRNKKGQQKIRGKFFAQDFTPSGGFIYPKESRNIVFKGEFSN